MNENWFKWMKIDLNEWKLIQMNENWFKWMKID